MLRLMKKKGEDVRRRRTRKPKTRRLLALPELQEEFRGVWSRISISTI